MPWLPPVSIPVDLGEWEATELGGGILARFADEGGGTWSGFQHQFTWYDNDHESPFIVPIAGLIAGTPNATGRVRLEFECDVVARDPDPFFFVYARTDGDDIGVSPDTYLAYEADRHALVAVPVTWTHVFPGTSTPPMEGFGNDYVGHLHHRLGVSNFAEDAPFPYDIDAHVAPVEFMLSASVHAGFVSTSNHVLHIFIEVAVLPPLVEPHLTLSPGPPGRRAVDFQRVGRGGMALNRRRAAKRVTGAPADPLRLK